MSIAIEEGQSPGQNKCSPLSSNELKRAPFFLFHIDKLSFWSRINVTMTSKTSCKAVGSM